jgi:2-methylcitrate dehydratase PrpD
MTLSGLARFAVTTDGFSPAVLEKSKACLLYALAVGAAGVGRAQPAAAARAFAASGGPATRFHDGARCDAATAALANGTLLHARAQDDAHPAGHVGAVVVSAALAVAESTKAEGSDLVAALVAGYEVALRIGRDHAADLSARGFRTTPAYGVFGAAAAAGRLLRLDRNAMTHALSLAANIAGGLREYSEAGSEDYAFQAGFAASNGIAAARLAAAGATGAASALDGKAGFFRAYGEAHGDYGKRVLERLGESFEMLAVTYKPYPICQFHRGLVRGMSVLRERAGAIGFEAAMLRMHPFEADFFGVRFAGPFAAFPQTFMSAPFCAALGWTRGTATLAGLTDFRAEDVLALVPRIAIAADPSRPRYSPRIEVQLATGARLEWEEREAASAYLLTWDAARSMAAQLASETGIAPETIQRLVTAVEDMNVPDIVDAMRAACDGRR